jgi:hypothetical protein
MRQKLVLAMANEDEWLAWEGQKEIYRENINRWMAELENHPIPEYREIGRLLKQAVDIWDTLLEHNIPAVVGEERFETYRRSLPHIVQYLAHRIFQLARLSGLEHVKSCISCSKYFYAYKSASRFCSPRCFSVYELFLRPMNSLFELTRENFMPNMWRECIICSNKASRWIRTRAGGWKFDWVHSIKSPHIDYLREGFDEYKVTCMSPFCQWAALNLRKLRKGDSGKEEIEQRKKRWQAWVSKVQSTNYTPSISLLKGMLEAIAEGLERALVVYSTFYILWNSQPPQRYILFNDTKKLRRAALVAMFVPLNPPNYRHFFFEFMKSLIDRVPQWLEVVTGTWSNAITNPEVTLFYPSSTETSVFAPSFAEALTVLDTTPVVHLSNDHLPNPAFKSWSEVEEALYETVIGFVKDNKSRLDEIVKIASEKP